MVTCASQDLGWKTDFVATFEFSLCESENESVWLTLPKRSQCVGTRGVIRKKEAVGVGWAVEGLKQESKTEKSSARVIEGREGGGGGGGAAPNLGVDVQVVERRISTLQSQ